MINKRIEWFAYALGGEYRANDISRMDLQAWDELAEVCGFDSRQDIPSDTKNILRERFMQGLNSSMPLEDVKALLNESRNEHKNLSSSAAELGRKGGSSRSESKVHAARENGKKGGRPPKNHSA